MTHTALEKTYYAATANPSPNRPALQGDVHADVCVIGAGYTGLSTALFLAEAGLKVVVLEAVKVGFGASGRNGGQLVNSYSRDIDVVEKQTDAHGAGPCTLQGVARQLTPIDAVDLHGTGL